MYVFRNRLQKNQTKNNFKYIKSQAVLSEPFRDKIGQLNSIYQLAKKYIRTILKLKTLVIGLTEGKAQVSQQFQIY